MKAQTVRLLDVVAIGPFMWWSARFLPGPWRPVMRGLALATIAYNGLNYLRLSGQAGDMENNAPITTGSRWRLRSLDRDDSPVFVVVGLRMGAEDLVGYRREDSPGELPTWRPAGEFASLFRPA